MSPEEQRIAIAEWCGWRWVQGEEPTYGGTFKQSGWKSSKRFYASTVNKSVRGLPDYLNDLNAMWGAESHLESTRPQLALDYTDAIKTVINKGGPVGHFRFVHATAAQRAEALLKTINKWKPTP